MQINKLNFGTFGERGHEVVSAEGHLYLSEIDDVWYANYLSDHDDDEKVDKALHEADTLLDLQDILQAAHEKLILGFITL